MGIDWRVAAIVALITLSIYYIGLKHFFNKANDWRVFIPLLFLFSLAAMAYFIQVRSEVKAGTESYVLAIGLMVLIGIVTVTSMYAVNKGPVGVVAPILAFSAPLIALLGAYLLPNEQLTTLQWAGIALGLISVYLVSVG